MSGPIELRARTAFSFLDGTATPEALVEKASGLGYSAIGITDNVDLGAVSRFVLACRQSGIRPIVGATVSCPHGEIGLLVRRQEGFRNLSKLVTLARSRHPRGRPVLDVDIILRHLSGLFVLTGGPSGAIPTLLAQGSPQAAATLLRQFQESTENHVALEVQRHHLGGSEVRRNESLVRLSEETGIPLVATHEPRYLDQAGRLVHDAFTALRAGCTLEEAADRGVLRPSGEWMLETPDAMVSRWSDLDQAVAGTGLVANSCDFDLSWLSPPLPLYVDSGEQGENELLRSHVFEGATERWGDLNEAQIRQIEHELAMISRLGFSGYFLCIWDVVRFARSKGILCQGRGSAANSAVAFCLGVTAVDPISNGLLFERFLSDVRVDGQAEAPDIDVDFEHDRREEIFEYIYQRFGRNHAAIACMVQQYHAPSAVQDVMRVLGYPIEQSRRLSKRMAHMTPSEGVSALQAGLAEREQLDLSDARGKALLTIMAGLDEIPRMRSTHPGGFVISSEPLSSHMAIETTAAGRTILQFDKDDLDNAGIAKFDILGLAALSAVRLAFDAVEATTGERLELHGIPTDDEPTFDLIRSGKTIGIFQIESRAQIASLVKTQPENLYDLVVQLALIRPGPIQADFVHPYIRRRRGAEAITFPHESLRPILGRTMGIPIFQEQAMRISMELGGFSAAEADDLRRAMGHQKKLARLKRALSRLREAMIARGVDEKAALKIAKDLEGFANYGFPESHSWSFALISYASAYLKANYPTQFFLGILNSWPMGFYPASTVVHDARRHGVEVLPPCLGKGDWDCTLEPREDDPPALRIGWRHIRGLRETTRDQLRQARSEGQFHSVSEVVRRAKLSSSESALLARAGAFELFEPGRRQAAWTAIGTAGDVLPLAPLKRSRIDKEELSGADLIFLDYLETGISVRGHPVEHLRPRLKAAGAMSSTELEAAATGSVVRTGGLVVIRQHPQTAGGTVFLLLEDETGFINLIVSPELFKRNREIISFSPFLLIEGRLENAGGVINVVGRRFRSIDGGDLRHRSRDFR